MSNIDKRGLHSVTAEAARSVVAGFGIRSYLTGLDAVADLIAGERLDAPKYPISDRPAVKEQKRSGAIGRIHLPALGAIFRPRLRR